MSKQHSANTPSEHTTACSPRRLSSNIPGNSCSSLGWVSKPSAWLSFPPSSAGPPVGAAERAQLAGQLSTQGGHRQEKVLEPPHQVGSWPKPALANAAGSGCLGLSGSFKACAGKCTLHPLLQFYKVLHTLPCIGAAAALTPAN